MARNGDKLPLHKCPGDTGSLIDEAEELRLIRNREYQAEYRAANRGRIKELAARWRAANREKARSKVAAWQAAHPERQRQAETSYRVRNPGKRKASCAVYRAANKEKEAAYRAAYAARNKDRLAEKAAGRRARKLRATPAWADKAAMRAVYADAQRLILATGVPHHVDHVVPLKSEWVCGLHCPANLEIRIGGENLSKGNRRWPDMF